jgi:hypothetical protein
VRLDNNKSLLLAPKMVGLPLFGGVDQETGLEVETYAFQEAFVPSRCISAWRKVGAATDNGITRACLDDVQVKAIGDGNKDTDQLYLAIQMANDLAIYTLTMGGCEAQWLNTTLKKKKVGEESICVPNTAARREWVAIAHGHGGQFHASNSMNITDNNIFIAFKMKDQVVARAAAKKDKKCQQQQQMNKEKAPKILYEEGKGPESYLVKDLDVLLAWHQVKDLQPKPKKENKMAQWREILVSLKPPPPYERWKNEDEHRLIALQSNVIGIKDIMFG